MFNICILILVFIVCLAFFHYLFVYKKNLSKKRWKQVDYIWFSLSIIGLISLGTDMRISQFSEMKRFQESQMEVFWDVASQVTKNSDASYACLVSKDYDQYPLKTDYASNKEAYHFACSWMKETATFLSEFKQNDFPEVNADKLPSITFGNSIVIEDYKWLQREISEYNLLREAWLEASESSDRNVAEQLLYWFSAILIAIALALRVTKITGEVMHEK